MERLNNAFNSTFYNNKSNKKTSLKFNIKNKKVIGMGIISTVLLIIIIIIIVKLFLFYTTRNCKKLDLLDYIVSFRISPCVNKSIIQEIEEAIEHEEVFNIGDQSYTYEQAKCKCAAYGARLAKKHEIIGAYNKGAEWCSYGWSEGQNAYYPTQRSSWKKSQHGSVKHRDDCGVPGVNGGYFSDPELKFGVNCFGKKPVGSVVKHIKRDDKKNFCELKHNKKASKVRARDNIQPFNKDQWSQNE